MMIAMRGRKLSAAAVPKPGKRNTTRATWKINRLFTLGCQNQGVRSTSGALECITGILRSRLSASISWAS